MLKKLNNSNEGAIENEKAINLLSKDINFIINSKNI